MEYNIIQKANTRYIGKHILNYEEINSTHKRAEELAKTAVKEPDVTASESILDKYASKAEGKEESTKTTETAEETTKKDNKTKKVKFGKKEN